MSKGVLLINLGSPESPSVNDVKKYLGEFLMDKRVIDIPYLVRLLLVKGIIVPRRAKHSAALYEKIWTKDGSPLIHISKQLHHKVAQKSNVPVALAMRYGMPDISGSLKELLDQGCRQILVIPLYPQHAMSTTETVIEAVKKELKKYPKLEFDYLPAFYNDPNYLSVLSQSIKDDMKDEEYDHLLFSYHGIPERHIRKTDPTGSHCKIDEECCNNDSVARDVCYRHHCFATTESVAKSLNLEPGTYSVSFQSRLGKDPWLQPYTSSHISELAQKGVKKLAVVTPAFVSDCLETLEEIAMEARNDFLSDGGESFKAIKCLNDRDDWATTIAHWIENWQTQETT